MVRVTLTVMAVFVVSVLALVGILLFVSPGTPKQFVDGSGKPLVGSISEKIKVNIGAVEQGMFIKGRNARNPVLMRPPCRRDPVVFLRRLEYRGRGRAHVVHAET